jgi:flagellar biosynthetic protein FliP
VDRGSDGLAERRTTPNMTTPSSSTLGPRLLTLVAICAAVCALACLAAHAQGPTPPRPPTPPTPPQDWFNEEAPQELALSLRLLFSLGALALLPSAFVTMTSFMRIIIVLGFLRSALGTQQTPPNTVLFGLAFFLTLFVMQPVWTKIDAQAVQPYMAGTMSYQRAITVAAGPLRDFMLQQTRERDLLLFIRLGHLPKPKHPSEVPMRALLPAFAISELKSAFQVGFVVYLPFIVLDIVVASALMSMGMLMLPPGTISLPLKILLFVMIDGWHLIARSLVFSFG